MACFMIMQYDTNAGECGLGIHTTRHESTHSSVNEELVNEVLVEHFETTDSTVNVNLRNDAADIEIEYEFDDVESTTVVRIELI
jgi:hypothetical protein